jgi:hypothetical protein
VNDVNGTAFAVYAFGVWRVSHLLSREDGPFDVVFRVRRTVGQGFFGSLLDCFLCVSLWVAAPFAFLVGDDWLAHFVSWFALSGVASILFLFTERSSAMKEGK